MNNAIYAVIAIVVIVIIVAAALALTGSKSPAGSSTTVATTAAYSYPTTVSAATNTTNTVTTNSTSLSNSSATCTASNSSFSCSDVLFSATNRTGQVYATIGQNTGTYWSGFGVGFAPKGTKISGGIPEIAFYSSAYPNPTGGNLTSGSTVHMLVYSGSNVTAPTSGTLWACFVNSGTVYVATSGCSTSGGLPAQYVMIGNVTT